MKKKILAFIFILIFTSLPVNANAASNITADEVYRTIHDNLVAHKKEFTIDMSTNTMNEIRRNTDMFDVVTAMDDEETSKDADYLNVSVSSWRVKWSWSSSGSASLTVSVVYRSTKKQETKVDTKIASVLEALKLDGKSDYKKVKAIHDYIIKRVSYDQTYTKQTAYNALINKSSVCQGYAVLAYRMFTDAGIECRIITGLGNGGSHAWNIVKVKGKWYNIDLTWDDPITSTGEQVLRYDYFMKNNADFSDHVRDKEFNTKAFLTAYPIAKSSY